MQKSEKNGHAVSRLRYEYSQNGIYTRCPSIGFSTGKNSSNIDQLTPATFKSGNLHRSCSAKKTADGRKGLRHDVLLKSCLVRIATENEQLVQSVAIMQRQQAKMSGDVRAITALVRNLSDAQSLRDNDTPFLVCGGLMRLWRSVVSIFCKSEVQARPTQRVAPRIWGCRRRRSVLS